MNQETGEIKELTEEEKKKILSRSDILLSKPAIKIKKGKMYWIELDHLPKKNCPDCFERGHIGKDTRTGLFIPCRCLGLRVQRIGYENLLTEIKRLEEQAKENSESNK